MKIYKIKEIKTNEIVLELQIDVSNDLDVNLGDYGYTDLYTKNDNIKLEEVLKELVDGKN